MAVETQSWEIDSDLKYLQVYSLKERMFGLAEGGLIGRSFLDFMTPDDADKISRVFYCQDGSPRAFSHVVVRYISAEGFLLVVEINGTPVFGDSGDFLGFHGAECEIAAIPVRTGPEAPPLDVVFGLAPIAACVVGRDGRLLSANAGHAALSGRPLMDTIGVRVGELHPASGEKIVRDFAILDAGGVVPDHEVVIRDREYLIAVTPILDVDDAVSAICVIHLDITERKRLERELQVANQRLSELNAKDYLTGAYNRRCFDDALAREVARLGRSGGALSLALIDVDNFKLFNDRYGHLAGDRCLTAVAKAMSGSLLRGGDSLFRYGGEEFAVIMPDTDEAGAVVVAEHLRAAVYDCNIPHADTSWGRVTISIGLKTIGAICAFCTQSTGEAVIQSTDEALYLAKANGRNAIAFGDKVCRTED